MSVEDDESTRVYASPDGEFRTADGREYKLRAQGVLLYGGPSEEQVQQLLPLGGDQYYDRHARERLSVVRDDAGNVKAIRGQRKATTRIYYRREG